MDILPLWHSTLAIQIHAAAAILATVLGAMVLLSRKGTPHHKLMGRVWVTVMAVTAMSSFFIAELRMFGPYSAIHGLSVLTLVVLVRAIHFARTGNIKAHRASMTSLYGFSLILAGAFTLVPGRRMYEVVFADGGVTAAWIGAIGFVVIVSAILAPRLRRLI
jgi:uncharacterized membrane protein